MDSTMTSKPLPSPDFFHQFYRMSLGVQATGLGVKPKKKIDDFLSSAILRGEQPLAPDLSIFTYHSGNKKHDVASIAGRYSELHFISQRLYDLWKENKVTGWDTYPVTLLDKEGKDMGKYYGLIITGRCKEIIPNEPPFDIYHGSNGKPFSCRFRGATFDPTGWDGSDLFVAEGRTSIYAHVRVRDLMKKAKILNAYFPKEPLATEEISTYEEVEPRAHLYKKMPFWKKLF